jgi:hypothetical protein
MTPQQKTALEIVKRALKLTTQSLELPMKDLVKNKRRER